MVPYLNQSASLIQPPDSRIQHLLMMSYDVNLQTWHNQYGPTTETMTTNKRKDTTLVDDTLHLPRPPTDGIPKLPKFPLSDIANNPNIMFLPIIALWMT